MIPIKRRVIKVGGGRLYADQYGTAVLRVPDSNEALLINVLYILLLGVNLLSGRKLCQRGLIGHFNKHYLWLDDKQGNRVIQAKEHRGVYIVLVITKGFEETAFTVTESLYQLTYLASLTYLALPAAKAPAQDKPPIQAKDTNIQPKLPLAPLKKRQLDEFEYDLWHRRLNHLGPAVMIRANKVANLAKPIPLARILGKVCDVCAKAKMTDGRNLWASNTSSCSSTITHVSTGFDQ